MSSTYSEDLMKFIDSKLIDLIMKNDERLSNQRLIDYKVTHNNNLDGFMSILYQIQIRTKPNQVLFSKNTKSTSDNDTCAGICNDDDAKDIEEHNIIAKFMKGDEAFRKKSKSYTQFANEIFIYSTVLPYYNQILDKSKSSIKVSSWIPHVYFTKYGIIDGLGNGTTESVLAVENLSPRDYRCGPRLYLDREHLLLMTKPLAEYHACTYALRIKKDPKLEELKSGIVQLPWMAKDGETNLYEVLYRLSFDRFYEYFDRIKDSLEDDKLVRNINNMRRMYFDRPTRLLQSFAAIDETFSVILHGDYCRNNVLFQYDSPDGFNAPKDLKMIDFQELRYGTPAIDLSFYMYMNMEPSIMNDFWMELLKYYHSSLIEALCDILKIDRNDEKLKPYSFDEFNKHFSKFAFYGAMIVIHFLPWMVCNKEECSRISTLFEEDMHCEEFKQLSLWAGGDKANAQIFNTVIHASKMGYMDIFENCSDSK